MKSTGMVRPIDKMGRVVIPKEMRAMLNLKENVDSVELYMDGDMIIIKKYTPTCVFCNQISSGITFAGYNVCNNCIEKLDNLKAEKEIPTEEL